MIRSTPRSAEEWFAAALWIMALAAIALPLLLFFYCSIRYLADVTPALVVLSGIACWRMKHRAPHAFAIALLVYSSAVGVLLAITGYSPAT